uniref:Uncharacterized protein n=1 Tax=Anguilla anguilla TaxID=7936 RepID=A0A0E9SZG1_ANGAN
MPCEPCRHWGCISARWQAMERDGGVYRLRPRELWFCGLADSFVSGGSLDGRRVRECMHWPLFHLRF